MKTICYKRSRIYSFYELNEKSQEKFMAENPDSYEDTFYVDDPCEADNYLPLDMFMRVNYPNGGKSPLQFDGVYGITAFSAYTIKLSRCGSVCIVAYKVSE